MERIGETVVFVRREYPLPGWLANQHKYEADFTVEIYYMGRRSR